jgi:hypothetical protein
MSEKYVDGKHCTDFLQNLSLYIDHEASTQFCAELEQHLMVCPDCEVVVDTLERTVALYRTLPPPEMPEHLRKRLFSTLQLETYLNSNRPRSKPNGDEHDPN